jgi:uncharacterized protein (TIGR01244 family)
MRKQISLLIFFVVLAVSSSAQDHDGQSIAFMKADQIGAGESIPPETRFLVSGQPDEAVLRALADAGFTTVVDLRLPREDRGLDERETVEQLGMVYAPLPISGASDITFENAGALDQLLAETDGPVLLHCGSGNRVGALFALREKLLGASSDEALAVGKAAGLTRSESVVSERLAEK